MMDNKTDDGERIRLQIPNASRVMLEGKSSDGFDEAELERRVLRLKVDAAGFHGPDGVDWEHWASGEYGGTNCECCDGPIINEPVCVRRTDDTGPVYHLTCTRTEEEAGQR